MPWHWRSPWGWDSWDWRRSDWASSRCWTGSGLAIVLAAGAALCSRQGELLGDVAFVCRLFEMVPSA